MAAAAMTALKTVRHLAAVTVVVVVAVQTVVVNQARVTLNSVRGPTTGVLFVTPLVLSQRLVIWLATRRSTVTPVMTRYCSEIAF